jgi:hypothetical protein
VAARLCPHVGDRFEEDVMVSYWRYWGKAERDGDRYRYHLLPYHCLDVAAVAADRRVPGERFHPVLAPLGVGNFI